MEMKVENKQIILRHSHLIFFLVCLSTALVTLGGFLVLQQLEIISIRKEVNLFSKSE